MPSPDELNAIMALGKSAAARLAGPRALSARLLRDLVTEVRLGPVQVSIMLNPMKVASALELNLSNGAVKLDVATRLKRRGGVMRLITQTGRSAVPTVDHTLIKNIVRGRTWWKELEADSTLTLEDLGRREGVSSGYIVRIVRLAFLSPQTLASIIDGTLPTHLTVSRLTETGAIAARWDRQLS